MVRVLPFHLQFQDTVLKVKDAKTKPEVGQSGSRGSRHGFRGIPTPPRMAEFPMTQDGTCGVLDPRHNTSSMGLSPSLCFYKKLFQDNKKRGCIWLHVSYDLDSISYHFDFVCYNF